MSAAFKSKTIPVFIGLGSNIRPETNLPKALRLLAKEVFLREVSNIYQTPAVGSRGPDFLNAVALIETDLDAQNLRDLVLRPLETRLGRHRSADKNAPRPIDLDILVYDGQALDPEIWEQAHKAVPLSELAPRLRHPLNGKTLRVIAHGLRQQTRFQVRPEVAAFIEY